VTPGAKADRVDGVERQDDGTALLRVRLKAPPSSVLLATLIPSLHL
jgi:uncharacterized protein YggU (UPF0235/DUF167 family)